MGRHATYHDLEGASVFITGGGSGIGAALTEGFLAEGAKVAFVQRSDATEFVDEMAAKFANRPLFMECDITDTEALVRCIDRAADAHGPVTRLVNNAAHDLRHPTEGFTVAEWDAMQAVNLRPHFFSAQACIPGMKAAGGGSIINYSSISFMMGAAGFHAYTAAKAGIVGLTRGLARELGPDNIRVNAVMPGWVLTERQLRLWGDPAALEAHLARQCIPRHLEPADMIGVTLFLASEASRMMTSQALVVDGGVAMSGC